MSSVEQQAELLHAIPPTAMVVPQMGRMSKNIAGLRYAACQTAWVSVAALAVTSAVAAAAMEPNYCVRPLSVVSARESADLERKLAPRLPCPIEPYLFQSWKGARYPVVTRAYSVKRVDGLDAGRSLFWSFSVDHRLVGPRTYGFSVSVEDGSVAVDRSGQSLLIGSTEDEPAQVFPRHRLVRQVDEGAIAQVDQELQTQIDEPRFAAWSDVLDGFVI